jgi:lipopolysaccharide transport system ATP-binding protein
MKNVAIRAEGLGKQYRIGGPASSLDDLGGRDGGPSHLGGYTTLRETLATTFLAPLRKSVRALRRAPAADRTGRTIWALKDVGLEIRTGEVVGLIGRNGAGKSTLLKILSRITTPTLGWAEIHGRVGSLLEVGTGFHPELTGRDNIFLNGAILGMKKAETARKFDEIVAFAELERFIDTPVKHYSSGMYMRLAFAVAAHLEPEILLVDEVLAVGDGRFQRKCLNKMQTVGQEGRTVLFVSHNMPAVTRLCPRVILLGDGKILRDGPAKDVVGLYMGAESGTTAVRQWTDPSKAPGGAVSRLRSVRVLTENQVTTDAIDIRRPVQIEMQYDVLRSGYELLPYFGLYDEEGVCAFSTCDVDPAWRRRVRPEGRWVSTVTIPGNMLAEGMHFVSAGVLTLNPVVWQFGEREAVAFQVIDTQDGDSARGDWVGNVDGVMRPLLEWRSRPVSEESRVVIAASVDET